MNAGATGVLLMFTTFYHFLPHYNLFEAKIK
jgi:hypothetical protein